MTTFDVILQKKCEYLSRGMGNENSRGCYSNFFFGGGAESGMWSSPRLYNMFHEGIRVPHFTCVPGQMIVKV